MLFHKKEQVNKILDLFQVDEKIKKETFEIVWSIDRYCDFLREDVKIEPTLKVCCCSESEGYAHYYEEIITSKDKKVWKKLFDLTFPAQGVRGNFFLKRLDI